MKRIVKWTAAILILAVATSFATAQPPAPAKALKQIPLKKLIGKAASKLSKADELLWLLEIADEATRQDSEKIARAFERSFSEKAMLVSGTESVDVVVEQSTSYWRGTVKQQLTMPCTATLAIDLNKLLENATYNPQTKTIEIYLPPLSVVAVESHTSKYTTEPEYSGGCWEWYDSGRATALEVGLLKSDWGSLVREKIDPNAEHLREGAKNATERLIRSLIEPINMKLKIVVNP